MSSRVSQNLERYIFLIKWLIKDIAWRFKRHFVVTVTLLAMDLAFQLGAFALFLKFLTSVQDPKAFKMGPILIENYDFQQVSLVVTVVIGCLLILSSIAQLIARLSTAKLMRIYEEFCGKRLMRIVAAGTHLKFHRLLNTDLPQVNSVGLMVNRDARMCARMINEIIGVIIPFLIASVAVSYALYLNLYLTLFLAGFFVVGMGAYVWLGRKGSKSSVSLEQYGKAKSEQIFKGVRYVNSTADSNKKFNQWIDGLYTESGIKKFLDAYEQRLKVAHIANFIGSFQMAIGITIFVIYFSLTYKRGQSSVSEFIQYALAIRYGYSNIKAFFKQVTNINTLMPFIDRYIYFVTQNTPTETKPINTEIQISGTSLTSENNGETLSLIAGHIYEVIADGPLDRISLGVYLDKLFYSSESKTKQEWKNTVYFHTDKFAFYPDLAFEVGDGKTLDDLTQSLGQLPNAAIKDQFIDFMKRHQPSKRNNEWRRLDPSLRLEVALCRYPVGEDKNVIHFISAKGFAGISGANQDYWLNRYKDQIVIFFHEKDLISPLLKKDSPRTIVKLSEPLELAQNYRPGEREEVDQALGLGVESMSLEDESFSTDDVELV